LKKSRKKNKNFYFSKNGSIWVLMLPIASLITPRTPKHLLEASIHSMDISIFFSQNQFLDLKLHFSRLMVFQAGKKVFLSYFSLSKFSYRLYFMTHHVREQKYITK